MNAPAASEVGRLVELLLTEHLARLGRHIWRRVGLGGPCDGLVQWIVVVVVVTAAVVAGGRRLAAVLLLLLSDAQVLVLHGSVGRRRLHLHCVSCRRRLCCRFVARQTYHHLAVNINTMLTAFLSSNATSRILLTTTCCINWHVTPYRTNLRVHQARYYAYFGYGNLEST